MEEELGLKNIGVCSAPILESAMKIASKPDKKAERFRLLSKTLDQTDTFAVVVIRPRNGGNGLRYVVPKSIMAKLDEINKTIQDPLGRYMAVMALPDIFSVEPAK